MTEVMFFFFSAIVLYGAFRVITHKDLVVCSLHLAGSMLALAGLFFLLGAHFIAAVQVIVYAGAVMVLFIIVVMLFDMKDKKGPLFSREIWFRSGTIFFLLGLMVGLFPLSLQIFEVKSLSSLTILPTKEISSILFSKYIFAFEVLGVLLLLIAVGVAVLCQNIKKGE